jgi:hypothetical protein
MSRTPVFPHAFVIHFGRFLAVLFCIAILLGCAYTQDTTTVPQLVKFSGTIASAPAGTVGVIFALYKDQTGGAPLWQEVQNLTVDSNGHYTSLLGAHSATGIPLELFANGEARWLGVQPEGQPEQPRVLLVSVPYALKASDAETLGGLPASAFLRAGAATVAVTAPTNFINAAAVTAAVNNAVTAGITVSNPTLGYVPYFYDASGDLKNSALFQATSGFVGLGTTTPVALLSLLGTNPSMRIENYSNTVGDSPNFNFYSGRGTASTPLATRSGDNLGQFAASGYTGSGFPGSSKVKVSFVATENWSPTSNGTAMTFATTANGTTARAERMRIDNTGNVGIGTTTPDQLLTVNGSIHSTGGFVFPDGTTQSSAATSGISLTSPDTSIMVAGTAVGPTVAVNTAVIQKRVTGSCSVGQSVTSVNADGSVNCAAGPQGPPGPASPVVRDANGNVLGTLISLGGFSNTDVTIYTNGYFVTVGITGLFPVGPNWLGSAAPEYPTIGEIFWSGAGCTGTAAIQALPGGGGSSTFTKSVLYSAQANALMVPAGTGITATSVSLNEVSSEYFWSNNPPYPVPTDGVSFCSSGSSSNPNSMSGWQLVAIDPATTLGWTVSGNPLSVAGPLQLP